MDAADITVVAVFHAEGGLALPALASLDEMVAAARQDGINVQPMLCMDAPNEETARLVRSAAAADLPVHEVAFHDLGLARNHCTRLAKGRYMSFLDGDDLWGREWLRLAYAAAEAGPETAVWHPQSMFLFIEDDFDRCSMDNVPGPGTYALHLLHSASDDPGFDPRALMLENMWGAVAFARRETYLAHPYRPVSPQTGFGIEDWAWNVETLLAGHVHKVVDNTVHLHREKPGGGLGVENLRRGLLPYIPAELYDFCAAFRGRE